MSNYAFLNFSHGIQLFLLEPQEKKSASKLDNSLFISDIQLLIEFYQAHYKSTYLLITVITNN